MSAAQRATLAILGREAFAFAETVFRELPGPEKLAEAVKYLEDKAIKLGIQVTLDEARASIEKAWLEDKWKQLLVFNTAEM
nr:phage holin, LLH family [Desulforamulus aquiferis]